MIFQGSIFFLWLHCSGLLELLLPCFVNEEASLMILGCMGVSAAESKEWDLLKTRK